MELLSQFNLLLKGDQFEQLMGWVSSEKIKFVQLFLNIYLHNDRLTVEKIAIPLRLKASLLVARMTVFYDIAQIKVNWSALKTALLHLRVQDGDVWELWMLRNGDLTHGSHVCQENGGGVCVDTEADRQ